MTIHKSLFWLSLLLFCALLLVSASAPAANAAERDSAAVSLGDNGFFQLGSSNAVENPVIEGDLSVEMWVRLNEATAGRTIFRHGGTVFYELRTGDNGTIEFLFGDVLANTELVAQSAQSIADGRWHHIAGVKSVASSREPASLTVYIDGAIQGSTSGDVTFVGINQAIQIGQVAAEVDEIRVWNDARSQIELASLRYELLEGTEDDLYGYWPLDEGTGFVYNDLGPNAMHGQASIGNDIWIGRLWFPQTDGIVTATTGMSARNASDPFIEAAGDSFTYVPEVTEFGITSEGTPPDVTTRWNQVWAFSIEDEQSDLPEGNEARVSGSIAIAFHLDGAGGGGNFDPAGDYSLLVQPVSFRSGGFNFFKVPVLDTEINGSTVEFVVDFGELDPLDQALSYHSFMTLGTTNDFLAVDVSQAEASGISAEIFLPALTILILTLITLTAMKRRRS